MLQSDTAIILKQLLYQSKIAQKENKGIGSIVRAISVMLSKEDIDAVNEIAAQELAENENKIKN